MTWNTARKLNSTKGRFVVLTSLGIVTLPTTPLCQFANKNCRDKPEKLERDFTRYISQKKFWGPRTPHFADTDLSNFSLNNWKTNLSKFLQILRFQRKKAKNHRLEGPPNQNLFSGHLRSKSVDSRKFSVGGPLPAIFRSFSKMRFWEKST